MGDDGSGDESADVSASLCRARAFGHARKVHANFWQLHSTVKLHATQY